MKKHEPVVRECIELKCKKIVDTEDGQFCATYISPPYWWGIVGRCPIPPKPVVVVTPAKRFKKEQDKPMVPTRKYVRSGKTRRRKKYVE